MIQLTIQNKQPFMGKEIPVVLGGFGADKRCMSDKTIAEIHGQPEREIRRRITDNLHRFKLDIDFIDLKQGVGESHTFEMLLSLGYAKQSITQAEHIYILSERGYSKLIKIMDTDLAWEIHDKLMDEYFALRETVQTVKPMSVQDILIATLEEQKKIADRVDVVEDKINKQMTIDHAQQRIIQNRLSARVYERIAANGLTAVKENTSLYFKAAYKALKNAFGVGSYRDILVVDFKDAMQFIELWREPVELKGGM